MYSGLSACAASNLVHRHAQEIFELKNDIHQLREQVLQLTETVQRALNTSIPIVKSDTSEAVQRHGEEICELRNDIKTLKELVFKLNASVQNALETREYKDEPLRFDNGERKRFRSRMSDIAIPTSITASYFTDHRLSTIRSSGKGNEYDEEYEAKTSDQLPSMSSPKSESTPYHSNRVHSDIRLSRKGTEFIEREQASTSSQLPSTSTAKPISVIFHSDRVRSPSRSVRKASDEEWSARHCPSSLTSKSGCSTPRTILEAAEVGDREALQELLDSGACVHKRNGYGDTALHLAAAGGYDEVVRILLQAGATVDAAGIRLHTPLHRAATGGHFANLSALMEVDGVSSGLRTLHRTVNTGHVEVVRQLLSAGANIKLKDADGNTPLRLAVENGAADIVFHLLCHEKKTLEKEMSDTGKNRVLTFQDVYPNEHFLECARNINTVLAFEDVYPGVLRSSTARNALRNAAHDGKLNTVRALLDCITFGEEDLNLALRFSVEHGHSECAELLLNRGADKNYKVNGKSILDIATSRKYEKCVQVLMRAGAKKVRISK